MRSLWIVHVRFRFCVYSENVPRVIHFWVRDTDFCIYVEGRKKGSLEVHCGHPGGTAEGRPQELHPGAQGVGTGHCRLEGGGTV